jgi:two-component sensor histidine kinase
LELEPVYLDMDTAVPLGIIVNELVSNALKHAFPENNRGEICGSLFKSKNSTEESETKNSEIEVNREGGSKDCLKKREDSAMYSESCFLKTTDFFLTQLSDFSATLSCFKHKPKVKTVIRRLL